MTVTSKTLLGLKRKKKLKKKEKVSKKKKTSTNYCSRVWRFKAKIKMKKYLLN